MRSPAEIEVKAWQSEGILIEKYSYSAGTVEPLPKHSHREYQLGLSFNCQGEYYYRGTYHSIPIGSLSIIHSGEVHSPSERTYLPKPVSFMMMHLEPNLLAEVALEITEKPASLPFFSEPVLSDRQLVNLFYNLYLAATKKAIKLERDALFLDFLAYLITNSDRLQLPLSSYPTVQPAIHRVCDFLQTHYTDNIALEQLASIAGLSRYYLSRLFRRQIGISLSAYQIQLRIDRSRKLLSKGIPIANVALEMGFYDQSHFSSHFKRLVGTTPGNYIKLK